MNDGTTGDLIEKSNLLGIISALKLWLWVIAQKKDKIQWWSPTLLSLVLRYFIKYKKFSSSNILNAAEQVARAAGVATVEIDHVQHASESLQFGDAA